MKYYNGVAAAPGVAIGRLSFARGARPSATRRAIRPDQAAAELKRLDAAFETARAEVEKSRDEATAQLGAQYGQIFEAHLMLLNDAKLREKIETSVRTQLVCAEYAANEAFEFYANLLRQLRDAVYAERATDVVDVKNELLRALAAAAETQAARDQSVSILAAPFVAPSEASKLDPTRTLAIATEEGGRGSHTAIVAAALGVPAVVGLGSFLADACESTLAIVDGTEGLLILDPTLEVLDKYEKKRRDAERRDERLHSKRDKLLSRTRDGVEIAVEANIEFPYEAKRCAELGAVGVGLYRTEFLYLTSENGAAPDENAHFEAYKEALTALGPNRFAVIRTFDLGADKTPEGREFLPEKEPNPFMGLRSIRLSLRFADMFRTQLRAILRASVYGRTAVMFPLIASIREWRQAKSIFLDVCEELEEKGTPFDRDVKLGMMVETPAAVVMLDQFAPEVDFFSIGTNDLLQYANAVDRSNREVSALYAQESPALLRFIKRSIEIADYYGKPISVCGQMSSDPHVVPLLLGLGLRALSVPPKALLEIKETCEAFTIAECEQIANHALQLETADDVRIFLRSELAKKLASVESDQRGSSET